MQNFASATAFVGLLGLTIALVVGAGVLWSMNMSVFGGLGLLLKVLVMPLSFVALLSGLAYGVAGAYSKALQQWSNDVPTIAQVAFVAIGLGATAWAFRRGRRVEHETGTRFRGLALTSLTVLVYFTLGLQAVVVAFGIFG